MAPLASPTQNKISSVVQQSAPVDLSAPYDPSTLRGKTIVLTGGSTGLGAAFARRWASCGANLIIGDVNDDAGVELIAELRSTPITATATPTSPSSESEGKEAPHKIYNQHHHFIHTDVTSWPSQVTLFRRAAALSPTGEIDTVVTCAGISDRNGTITGRGFENPTADLAGGGGDGEGGGDDDTHIPPAPALQCMQVNLIGTMYTAHLALFWLQQNNNINNKNKNNNGSSSPDDHDPRDARDRHLLLVGSSAGLSFLPGVPEYVASKHGVTGLFRALRATSYRFPSGPIRVNMLCPYFVDTPILPARAVATLSGLGLGRLDDVVDAATRLAAGTGLARPSSSSPPPQRIAGRALVVGPRVSLLRKVLPDRELGTTTTTTNVDDDDDDDSFEREPNEAAGGGDVVVLDHEGEQQQGQGVWECYAHDLETVDFFIRRYVRLLNTIAAINGWVGFFRDFFHALFLRKEPKQAGHRKP